MQNLNDILIDIENLSNTSDLLADANDIAVVQVRATIAIAERLEGMLTEMKEARTWREAELEAKIRMP